MEFVNQKLNIEMKDCIIVSVECEEDYWRCDCEACCSRDEYKVNLTFNFLVDDKRTSITFCASSDDDIECKLNLVSLFKVFGENDFKRLTKDDFIQLILNIDESITVKSY